MIPKTGRVERLSENFSFSTLEPEQMHKISSLESIVGPVRFLDPQKHVGFDVFDEEHDQPVG